MDEFSDAKTGVETINHFASARAAAMVIEKLLHDETRPKGRRKIQLTHHAL
jgi:hypothetical protein